MGRTLLVGHAGSTWREWLKENRKGRDLLCLDPADAQQGIPGRVALFRGEHPIESRFYGSLDPQRAPHILIGSLAQLLTKVDSNGFVQLFAYRPSPLLRQTIILASQLVQPSEIFVARGIPLDLGGFPIGPEELDLEPAFPPMVQHAQRKAQWLRLIEQCETHVFGLSSVALEGTRLGSGLPLTAKDLIKAGLEHAFHAERCGSGLLVITAKEMSEEEISRAMDVTGTSRIQLLAADSYNRLLCAFARPNGEEIGMGMIRKIDWATKTVFCLCSAVPPVPVHILRIGSLRVDEDGRELGELKPWLV